MPDQDVDDSSPGTAASSRQAVRESFQDLKWVATSIGATSIVALLIALGYAIHLGGRGSALQLLWGLGLWSAAAALGFLFGIPKVLQGSQPVKPPPKGSGTDGTTTAETAANTAVLPAYQQRVNTNLEEISDWLTKIIVGVTLVQLKSIPPMADSLARRVTAGLPGGPHEGFGLAIIVTLGTLGFLFGYLVTRLYIQGALARAERRIGQDESIDASPVHALLTQMTEAVGARIEESAAAGGDPSTKASAALQRLADDYTGIDDPDWAVRTRRKEVAAAALTRAAVEQGVSREWLAAQKDEPMTLALAGLVQAAPRRSDAALLLNAAPRVQRKHVQYWILQAMLRLLQLRMVSSDERKALRRLLDQYEKTADASLLRLIEQVGARLDAAVT